MRFLKIKYAKGKVHIEYDKKNSKGGMDEFTMTVSDEPLLEFRNALQALDQDVIDMCELPEDYISKITVTSVSFNYGGEKEVLGATITSQMILSKSNCPLNLNTPNKISEPYGEDADEKQMLSEECVERLEELMMEAEKYVKGERVQGTLAFPEKTEGEAARAASA